MDTLFAFTFYLFIKYAQTQVTPNTTYTCPQDISYDQFGNSIVWPNVNEPNTLFPSTSVDPTPLCLNEEKFNVIRNCTVEGYMPMAAPQCAFSQQSYEKANKCPPGYDAFEWKETTICILLTEEQEWNNTCLSAGSSDTIFGLDSDVEEAVYEYLFARSVRNVWMPGKRFSDYEPVMWTLPGRIYGDCIEFDDMEILLTEEIFENGCFSLDIESYGKLGAIADCKKRLPILCLYLHESPIIQLACPRNFYTSRYEGHQDRCYSTHKIQMMPSLENIHSQRQQTLDWVSSECRGQIYSMESVEKAFIYEHIANNNDELNRNDRCLFGISPNVYIDSRTKWLTWVNSVSYVNWALPINTAGNLVTADRDGKFHWTRDMFTCISCQRTQTILKPEIVLTFHESIGKLYVVVYNPTYLWRERNDRPGIKCFTNSDHELVKTVKVESAVWSSVHSQLDSGRNSDGKDRMVYELKLYGDGPGYYWCDGHAMPNFSLIKSKRVVAYRKLEGEVFAVLVETRCDDCGLYFQEKYAKELANDFKDFLRDLRRRTRQVRYQIYIEDVRVMKIVSINETANLSKIIFHVTVSKNVEFDDSEEVILDISADMIIVYKIRNHLHYMLNNSTSSQFRYISLNSTEYCLPNSISAITQLSWIDSKIGQTTAPTELCLMSNGLPILRKCVGDFLYGGIWKNISTNQTCNAEVFSPITQSLYEIDRFFTNPAYMQAVIQNVTTILKQSKNNLIPADLFYLGKIMQTITKFSNNNIENDSVASTASAAVLHRNESENIFTIYNNLMLVNENITKMSAALNSTNILLDALDNIVNHLSSTNLLLKKEMIINLKENLNDGTIVLTTPKLLVYVIDPSVKNISGIALFRNTSIKYNKYEDFTHFNIKMLYKNQSASDLLQEDNLEIASFVPQTLLERLNETTNLGGKVDVMNSTINSINSTEAPETAPGTTLLPSSVTSRIYATVLTSSNAQETAAPPLSATPSASSSSSPVSSTTLPPVKIVITIYYNDLLFQEYKKVTYAKPNGKIISVSIPGYGPILPIQLPIYIKTDNYSQDINKSDVCGYWNFKDNSGWSEDGCDYVDSYGDEDPTVMCGCSHLTHFAYLVLGTYFHTMPGEDDVIITQLHQGALDLITLLGCSLSLIGIFGIIVTAIIFPNWREKANTKVLLHLSAAIAMQMILICFVNSEGSSFNVILVEKWYGCVALGAILHYSVLVAFSWMLITAYLQFMRYVRVVGQLRSSRFFLKSFFFGWGIPLIPVVLVVAFDPNSYIPNVDDMSDGICYPTGYGLYFGVIIPIALIVVSNLCIFLMVIYNIVKTTDGKVRTNNNDRDLTLAQLRLTILLFFLLGLTWIFGFCASTRVGLVFSYLFCLTATMQGFVLFLYFIILDPITRKLWTNLLKTCFTFSKKDELK